MAEKQSSETIIIGAGPAGMASAIELARAGHPFRIYERSDQVGGLATTYRFEEDGLVFLTDNGPHRFYSKNPYLYEFIRDLLNERWIEVKRHTRQYIDGRFYDYPVRILQALQNMGYRRASSMLFDYLSARIRYGVLGEQVQTFEDYIVAHFGRSLGEFNIINYTEKIWGIPASRIHPDWARQRIQSLNLRRTLLAAALRTVGVQSKKSPKTLAEFFYYPDRGAGLVYEAIRQEIERRGYPVRLNSWPLSVHHANQRIEHVEMKSGDGVERLEVEHLIESIPIGEFVELLHPEAPEEVLRAGRNLKFRSQVYLFITLDRDRVTRDQWIYFPEKSIPFGRISEMKNFSSKMAPQGKTSLFIEFFCFQGDSFWQMEKTQLLELALPYLEEIGFFDRKEIRQVYHFKRRNVYPIYDLQYPGRLSLLKDYLDSFSNLFYIGRPGRFRYNNQDHSLEMGFLAARSILEGRPYEIEAVGTEKEHYEKGPRWAVSSG